MSSATVPWPGYAPFAATVLACREEFVRVARGFWLIPEAIPPLARDDVALLYAFCRRLDDAVDEEPDRARAAQALTRFAAELHGAAPARPLVAAFVAGAARTGLPLACADHLLTGMAADLGPVRMPDDRALLRYAYRVSAAVGLMLAPLLGVFDRAGLQRVVDLGLALQLSNILIGVRGDAERDRVYLPQTRLSALGASAEQVLFDPGDRRFLPALAGLSALADRYYASAEAGAAHIPLRYRHGVVLLGRLYGALGRRAASGREVPVQPAGLPLATKLGYLLSLLSAVLSPRVMGLWPEAPHERALHAPLDRDWLGVHA